METAVSNITSGAKSVTLKKREYLVAPISLIVPGVLKGSQGALFYSADEIAKNVDSWNGVPLTIGHPGGSARTPDMLQLEIGRILNARIENSKLVADGYFETGLLPESVAAQLRSGEKLEISTGLFTQNDDAPGDYNGKPYTHVATQYRPDHVALLLNDVGACSLQDGCGVFNKTKNITQTGASIMNEAERKSAVDLIVKNCDKCDDKDREQLDQLTDAQLTTWVETLNKVEAIEAVQNAATKGFTDLGGSTHEWNAEKMAWISKLKEPVIANIQEPEKPQTTDEWLKEAPPEVQSAVRNSMQIEQREKDSIIEKLVANAEDKNEARSFLASTNLQDLRKIEKLVPKKVDYRGASPSLTNNTGVEEMEVLYSPE